MHLLRLRLHHFETHCWYASVLERPATVEFLISLSLQSPTHVKLYRSTTLLTSWIYAERVLLPWFRDLRCMNAAISSDLGLVQSSSVSNIVLRLSLWSSETVLGYVLAYFQAHKLTYLSLVSWFLIWNSTVSSRSSTSSLQSLNHWCKPASSVQSIMGSCTYCVLWFAILSNLFSVLFLSELDCFTSDTV